MAMIDVHIDTPLNGLSVFKSVDECRDRYGWFNVTFFHMWACSQCYSYIFYDQYGAFVEHSIRVDEMTRIEKTMIPPGTVLYPELFHMETIKDGQICSTIGSNNCQRLISCCKAAIQCCSSQVENQNWTGYLVDKETVGSCPRTWDGFACFQETAPGDEAEISCPSYITAIPASGVLVRKVCEKSGKWATNPVSGKEWTDYSICAELTNFRIYYYIGVTCNVISILCLVPACIIFLKFQQLRKQHRIRIHLNLLLSFIVTSCALLGWDHLIFLDRINNPKDNAIIYKESLQDACKVLYVLSRYAWTCNCAWMSLEGLHLYRLITHAFKSPTSILSYYFIGWLGPIVPIGIYSIIRVLYFDTRCWVLSAEQLEWIMYGPNIACILINVGFLVSVLRILLTQIQSHPNEPSNYRRALKATFLLVPLFGLQIFIVIYQPTDDNQFYFPYEVIAKLISNLQGAVVAIAVCFVNSEVHSQFRSHVSWFRNRHSGTEIRSFTFSTEMRRLSSRDTRLENIPLNCPNISHGAVNGNSLEGGKSNSSIVSLRCQTAQKDGTLPKEQML